ncbi:hypothetical protein ABZW10_33095 [Kitasatospora sp. NPDC004723]|uniref:hypothetical protein n=1 Tax=Kitasatospora sp. NPDC004723 TaxID=3154288 RepID=UPI0033B7332C
MTHTQATPTGPASVGDDPQQQTPGTLPAARPEGEDAVGAARPALLATVGRELVQTIGAATQALTRLGDDVDQDIGVSALTAIGCVGTTPAETVRAAARFLRQASAIEVHGLLWARTPDGIGGWEHRLTMLISSVDPDLGETPGATHHADARPSRTVVYVDALAEHDVTVTAAEGTDHVGYTPADALDAAALTLDAVPALAVDGLLWAQVAGRRGLAGYRITVLLSRASGEAQR